MAKKKSSLKTGRVSNLSARTRSKAKPKKSLTNSSKKVKGSVSTKKSKTLAKDVKLDEQLDDIDTLLGEECSVEDGLDGEVIPGENDDYEFFGDDDTVYPAE